jgi:hypothetical protein
MTRLQFAAARAVLGWTVEDIARTCSVSATALYRFERGETKLIRIIQLAVEQAFRSKGIVFKDEGDMRAVLYPVSLDSDAA